MVSVWHFVPNLTMRDVEMPTSRGSHSAIDQKAGDAINDPPTTASRFDPKATRNRVSHAASGCGPCHRAEPEIIFGNPC